MISKLPGLVRNYANTLINRLNHANRYTGGICNGNKYPEAELFEVDEVYEIIEELIKKHLKEK